MTPRMLTAMLAGVLAVSSLSAQLPDRALTEAMRAIYGLRDYTAFDWISARYLKGTLTLEGFVRTPQLKRQAEETARKTEGIEIVVNKLEILPAHRSDDDIRIDAYIAIFGSSALERYAPGGQLSGGAITQLKDTGLFGLEGADVGRGPHAIHIIVNGARVLLLGQVRTKGDRQIAEASVRSLPGVLAVTNQLRVPEK
jgi:osmotically-inducible protein OsmY